MQIRRVGYSVFSYQMLKCPATLIAIAIKSEEDIWYGLALNQWPLSLGFSKDTPVNLGEGYEPDLHNLKDLIVWNHFITFEQK